MRPAPRLWRQAFTVATLGSTMLVVPSANAAVINVSPDRNVAIFHNIDFIAGFGWEVGQDLAVEVHRKGQRIGRASGPTIDVDEGLPQGGTLEVNHGPEGEAQPGDCWTRYTPDIMPGDIVTLTQGTESDSVIIDPITIEVGPYINAAGHVQVEGRASYADGTADGTPIPMPALESGGVLNTSKFRGGPNELYRTPGTTDGWTMTFDPASPMDPSRDGREPTGLSTAQRLDLLMAGDYTMGYGHVAPLPRETQLHDGTDDVPGPALGCEASASESNRVSTVDDPAINIASGDLNVTGKTMAGTFDNDITEVIPRISDGTTTVTGAPVDVTGAVRDWAATFTRAQLETLADGAVTISADYVTTEGAIGGHTKTIVKDVVAPDVSADLAPGVYIGTRSVALTAALGETITYRTDGLAHGRNDRAYSGPIALGFGSTTIAARVTDAAGNITDKEFAYTINRPAPAAETTTPAAPLTSPGSAVTTTPGLATTPDGPAATAAASAQSKPYLRMLATAPRVKRSRASKKGLRVLMRVADDAKVVRIRVYRKLNNGARLLIGTTYRNPAKAGRYTATLSAPALRRKLRIGTYEIEATPGASRTNLGTISRYAFKIVKG